MESADVTRPEEAERKDEPEAKAIKRAFSEVLCSCPQRCWERVPQDVRIILNKKFGDFSDNAKQNEYLQSYIEMRSVYKRLWSKEERIGGRLQRRVSCKYKIPLETQSNAVDPYHITQNPTIHTNSKGKVTYVVNIKEGVRTIEVCQKAFMNIYGITEKRIRLQREKLITKLRKISLEAVQTAPSIYHDSSNSVKKSEEDEWSPKVAVLEAFFGNQLWRPEYIGMPPECKDLSLEASFYEQP